jgi:hypothetical protein
MQNYITKDDLTSLGTRADDPELNKLLDELNEKVATMVGHEIITSLTPEDAEKLVAMQDKSSDEDIAEWIIEHVPDYPEIIDDNINIVLGEYVESSDFDAGE